MCMGSIFSVTEFPPPSSAFSHFCQKAYLSSWFRRAANLYFLMIAVLSTTPVSPVHPVTNVGPLVVVLTVSLMKQAFEDWIWFLSDNVINSSLVAALHYGDWVEIPWSKLMVGDIVKLKYQQRRRDNWVWLNFQERCPSTQDSFDSPGFESFFAMQEGVHAPARSWDIARSASMRPHRTPQIYAAKARRKSMFF
ncbi:unnamed protein product [Sphagnum troendelagicum]|uniref:P-type ATPase N-terminal domain-containing protein n=1 Tax=Sphagnum troendelagicum TaxID=128251 RepID=A0ABP0UIP4_9BRYO